MRKSCAEVVEIARAACAAEYILYTHSTAAASGRRGKTRSFAPFVRTQAPACSQPKNGFFDPFTALFSPFSTAPIITTTILIK